VDLDRNEFMLALQEENIGTGLHFPALHLSRFYREKYGYQPGQLPHAQAAGESILSLPLYPLLSEGDQDDVVDAIKRVLAAHRRGRR
jgi:dTDP-4-amino-4,6-dideoxygalactose transaminase